PTIRGLGHRYLHAGRSGSRRAGAISCCARTRAHLNRAEHREQIPITSVSGFMETLGQDLRYAVRMLFANRGLTVVAVLSLALGIGANTTIFTFVDALLLKPPAVTDPGTLREVWQHNT